MTSVVLTFGVVLGAYVASTCRVYGLCEQTDDQMGMRC